MRQTLLRRAAALALGALMFLGSPAVLAEKSLDTDWLSAVNGFKIQLHALVAETLVLQLKTPTLAEMALPPDVRQVRWDSKSRLSDSLRSANAFLSMLEIADHSDRSQRVRQILLLWAQSSRRSLAEHREALSADALGMSAEMDVETAEFLEELKEVWKRLDQAYADLQAILG